MTSVIGTPVARAPRTVRTKSNSQLGTPKLSTGEVGYMMNNGTIISQYIYIYMH